ncbi:MAG: ABC transporter permease [Elusimicrobia bacterium]|nr:ABC transporter permease [Elusimicrobiota bacterium]
MPSLPSPKRFVLGRALSIARKEIYHLVRDPFTLGMALGVPVLLVLIFGTVLDYDVKRIPLVVMDRDQTRVSRELVDLFASADYFTPLALRPGETALETLEEGRGKVVLQIEPGFARGLAKNHSAETQILVDGSDNQTTGVIASYLAGLQRAASARLRPSPRGPPWALQTRFLFNPELNSRWFVVTGLFVVVIGIVSVLLTALTVAREWETGSMELLLSTPIQPLEIIVGKLAPYMALCMMANVLIYGAARLGFGVPFHGSHGTFFLACVLFLTCTLAQGLLISVLTRQQQLAMQFSNLTGLLPATLLSGFVFPVESMPVFFRYFTALLPARWFVEACRGIFLKGSGLVELAIPLGAMAAMGTALVFLAAKKFKKDLEP